MVHILPLMKEASGLLRALADEERLRLLNLLLGQERAVCVCELVDALRLPQYEVSRQLAVLKDAGLVKSEKLGMWVYYSVRPDLSPLAGSTLAALEAHLQGEAAREDRGRLERRLRLRRGGVCVIGYEPNKPFREVIPLAELRETGS